MGSVKKIDILGPDAPPGKIRRLEVASEAIFFASWQLGRIVILSCSVSDIWFLFPQDKMLCCVDRPEYSYVHFGLCCTNAGNNSYFYRATGKHKNMRTEM